MGGASPISYVAISAYTADHGIVGADRKVFETLLRAIDDEWLAWMAEKLPSKPAVNS